METRYLETLLTAVETGSFSRTAELMHLTQSAVSQRIKFLEDHFGQVLLDRGPQLRPTPAGEILVMHAREIVAGIRALNQNMARCNGEKRLSICCTPTFGLAFLPTVLNDFMQRNADLADFKFIFQQPEQALRGLQERLFDLAIVEHCNEIEAAGIDQIKLQQDELIFISAPQLKLFAGEIEVEKLLSFRFYARRNGCSSRELLKRNLAEVGHSIDDFSGLTISDDLRLTLLEVAAGRGVAFISSVLAQELLNRNELQSHRVKGFTHSRRRTLLVNHDMRQTPIFRDFMQSVCQASGVSPSTFTGPSPSK